MLKFLKFFVLISALLILSFYLTNKKPTNQNNFFIGSKNILLESFAKKNNIQETINNEIESQDGNWAVVVKDLRTQQVYSYNETQNFTAASLYKLAVMWEAYRLINEGSLDENEILSSDTLTLDNLIAEGNYQNFQTQSEPTVVSYSVKNALQAMITVSDNYAAILLAEKIGWENIDFEMKNQGLSGIDILSEDTPTVTAKSLENLFERIYLDTAVTKETSRQMKTLLLAQKINDRIPKYLPQDIKVAHKTGELDDVRNDAGIVYGKKSDYVFVFLTETPAPGDSTEEMANLSKKLFDVLEQ